MAEQEQEKEPQAQSKPKSKHPKCPQCGRRMRGPNHEQGNHHKGVKVGR